MNKPRVNFLILILALAFCAKAGAAKRMSFYITASDSVKLFVEVAGEGKPCLFVSGGPGSYPTYFYANGGNAVEKDLQMIYLHQRGCGRSEGGEKTDYSLARVVQDFEEVRKQLGNEKWVLMGNSFGALLAAQYALLHPDRVSAFISLNGILDLEAAERYSIREGAKVLGKAESELLKPGMHPAQAFGAMMGELGQRDLMHKLMFRDKAEFQKMMGALSAPGMNWTYSRLMWNYPEYHQPLSARSASIAAPALVISSRQDKMVDPEHQKGFRFPKATYVELDAGHFSYQEQPQAVEKAVKAFISTIR